MQKPSHAVKLNARIIFALTHIRCPTAALYSEYIALYSFVCRVSFRVHSSTLPDLVVQYRNYCGSVSQVGITWISHERKVYAFCGTFKKENSVWKCVCGENCIVWIFTWICLYNLMKVFSWVFVCNSMKCKCLSYGLWLLSWSDVVVML